MAKHVFFDMLSWRKAQQEVEEKRCEWISCKLERHFFLLTKVSADQTSDNINAKDNMMSPN